MPLRHFVLQMVVQGRRSSCFCFSHACAFCLSCFHNLDVLLCAFLSSLYGGSLPSLARWATRIPQLEYACLDAYAAVKLYDKISKFKDPIFSAGPSEVPAAGTKVGMVVMYIPS